jgi:hypothetical protein
MSDSESELTSKNLLEKSEFNFKKASEKKKKEE